MRQGPGLEGSEGRCCVGSARSLGLDRRWGRETPTQELLTHQVACRAQGLVSDVQFGGRTSDVNIVDDGDNLLFCHN